ncbi:MAG TPA: hypothetical protein VFD85_14125 [Gemmatimonadales bacterium]|nr:hypothetical protein [Gemmatimonadales bacterium]
MAPLTSRVPWLTGLTALAIVVAYLPPQAPAEQDYRGEWQSYPTPESRLAKRLGDDYRSASRRAEILHERDSLVRVLARRPRRAGAVVELAQPGEMDRAAREAARLATPPVAELSPEVQTVFALVPDSTWGGSSNVFLPAATDGRTCLVAVVTGPDFRYHHPRWRRAREELGPCAFFAAFGMPGPQISRWLESRAYDLARQPDWVSPPPPAQVFEGASLSTWFQTIFSHLAGAPSPYDGWQYGSPYWESPGLVGCAVGRMEACRRYLFTPLRDQMRYSLPGVVELDRYSPDFTSRVMASLVREQGPERFARFWRSGLQPEQAFDAAFTVPFAAWAPAWARATLGPVDVGVSTRPPVVLSTLVWIGLSIAGCAGLALARRVA